MTFDEMRAAYEEQVRGLIDGGVDLLLLETIFDTLNAKAASSRSRTSSRRSGVRLPLMISVTITDRSGRTLSGQTLDAFYTSIRHARPFSVGINCALGARDMRPYLAELARHRRVLRQLLSERRPAERVRRVRRAARRDRRSCCATSPTSGFVNIVGGCCGTTPDHIAAIAAAVEGVAAAVAARRWLPAPEHRRPARQRARSRNSPASRR